MITQQGWGMWLKKKKKEEPFSHVEHRQQNEEVKKQRTLNDGQQDDNDKEEEGDVEQDAVELVWVSSWVLQLVSNTTSSSHTHVHVEQIALPREERVKNLDLQSHFTHFFFF